MMEGSFAQSLGILALRLELATFHPLQPAGIFAWLDMDNDDPLKRIIMWGACAGASLTIKRVWWIPSTETEKEQLRKSWTCTSHSTFHLSDKFAESRAEELACEANFRSNEGKQQ